MLRRKKREEEEERNKDDFDWEAVIDEATVEGESGSDDQFYDAQVEVEEPVTETPAAPAVPASSPAQQKEQDTAGVDPHAPPAHFQTSNSVEEEDNLRSGERSGVNEIAGRSEEQAVTVDIDGGEQQAFVLLRLQLQVHREVRAQLQILHPPAPAFSEKRGGEGRGGEWKDEGGEEAEETRRRPEPNQQREGKMKEDSAGGELLRQKG
ncbi:hypothetical protein Dimus_021096 [Dionaea muscipula]